MSLSLHAEYLLGYLSGAKSLASRDVLPFTRIDPSDTSAQARALVKALALGVTDGRKGHPVRDASDVRARVLAMLSRESAPRSATASPTPEVSAVSAALSEQRNSDPDFQLEAILEPSARTA